MKKIICFLTGHKWQNHSHVVGNYKYSHKCLRCDTSGGIPDLTEKYIMENLPMPQK